MIDEYSDERYNKYYTNTRVKNITTLASHNTCYDPFKPYQHSPIIRISLNPPQPPNEAPNLFDFHDSTTTTSRLLPELLSAFLLHCTTDGHFLMVTCVRWFLQTWKENSNSQQLQYFHTLKCFFIYEFFKYNKKVLYV